MTNACNTGLQRTGSVVVVQAFSYHATCGIFLDLGWSPRLLHRQTGFFTTEPPGKPFLFFFKIKEYCHPAGLRAPGQEGRASVSPGGSPGSSPGVMAGISGLLEPGVPQV